VLNLASNRLGELVLPEGWTEERKYLKGKWQDVFQADDGTKQSAHPGKPEGIIALANAIPDMGAMSCANGGYFKACHCPQCVQLKQTERCGHCGQHKDQHKPKVIPQLIHIYAIISRCVFCD
jgi:hypothetical protein